MQLSEKDLREIDEIPKFGEELYYLKLGIGLQYEYSPKNIAYSAPYLEMGKELWKAFNAELYNQICDNLKKEPKEWIRDIITGDIRNLTIAIIQFITSKYNISISIAVPVAALLIKKGILSYCSKKPVKSNKTVVEILNNKRDAFKKK